MHATRDARHDGDLVAAREPSWRASLAALLACLLASAALFAGPLFGGRSSLAFDPAHPLYPAPWARPVADAPDINPITSDIDFFVLPGLIRLRQLADEGREPWWDDGQLCGYPLGANLPFPFLLPTTWPFAALDPVTTLDVLLWLHTALAAYLAWRAVRRFGGRNLSAVLGALLFALSTWMVTRWHLPQIGYTTAWWPGLLAALVPLRDGRRARALVELALFTALAFVSGFPQAGVAFAGGVVVLALLDRALRRPRAVLVLVSGLLLGLLLAWPQLHALRSVYGDALRASPESRAATAGLGLHPGALLGAVLPELFGRPSDFAGDDPPAASLAEWLPTRELLGADVQENPVENALYPGVVGLLLVGLLAWRRTRAPPIARRLAALAGIAVVVSLVYPFLVEVVPPLALLASAHVKRLLVLVAGCVPLAAALVLDGLRAPDGEGRREAGADSRATLGGDQGQHASTSAEERRTRRDLGLLAAALALVVSGVCAWAWLSRAPDADDFARRLLPQAARQLGLLLLAAALLSAYAARRRGAGLALLGLVTLDLASLAYAFNPFPPQREPAFASTASLEWLAAREGRIAVLGDELVLPPTVAATFGLRSVHGVAPMLGRRIAELLGCIEGPLVDVRDPRVVRPFRTLASLDHPLLDLLGVHTVVHADASLAARLGSPNAWESVEDGLGARDRPSAGPRAFVARGARVVPDAEQRLLWLSRPPIALPRCVLVEHELPFALAEQAEPGSVEVVRDLSGDVELVLDGGPAGVLVVGECFDAGWTAEVDGVATQPFVVDHALLGVPVPAGAERVVLVHTLPGWDGARLVGGFGALALVLGALVLRRGGTHDEDTRCATAAAT